MAALEQAVRLSSGDVSCYACSVCRPPLLYNSCCHAFQYRSLGSTCPDREVSCARSRQVWWSSVAWQLCCNSIVDAALSLLVPDYRLRCHRGASVGCLRSAAGFCTGVPKDVVLDSFRFPRSAYCTSLAGPKTATGQSPQISWTTALRFWKHFRLCH